MKQATMLKEKYSFDEKRHVHLLGDKPLKGTTTVIGEVLPPPLAWYGSGMAVKKLGWYDRKKGRANYLPDEEGMPALEASLDKIKGLGPKEYLKLLDEAYVAHNEYKKEKGDWGSQLHEKIEAVIKEAISNEGYLRDAPYSDPDVERFAKWGRGKQFIHAEAHVYSEELWMGGIVDFVYKTVGTYLGDVKTSKSIYPNQIIQMGLYDAQQKENGFYSAQGEQIGKPQSLAGYTVTNVPQEGDVRAVTYRKTKMLRDFATNIAQMHNTLRDLNEFLS